MPNWARPSRKRVCGAEGIRTPDLLHAMQALCQLSYSPEEGEIVPSLLFPSGGRT